MIDRSIAELDALESAVWSLADETFSMDTGYNLAVLQTWAAVHRELQDAVQRKEDKEREAVKSLEAMIEKSRSIPRDCTGTALISQGL